MIEPMILHDPRASEVLHSILEWPVDDVATGQKVRLIDVYSPADLAGLILGNLNREQMVLIRVDTVEALIADAVTDATARLLAGEA